jgi:hypothetical protein
MNQSCVRALARAARAIALTAVVTGFGASALAAQGATGKLEGRVFDQNQQPVANAQIVIEGTSFATTANPQGYYFFNGVPAGVYSVRFAYIGYKAVRVEGLRIVSGQTITLDRTLEATNVELQEITVVGAENALVPRDQVATKQLVDGTFTDNLPVDRIGAVFALQPGVMANSTGSSLSVRGGRPDENATYIDGVPVQPGNRGTGAGRDIPTLQVGTNAFEDASITTGAASAEFGNAQGGIIAITTKTGGQRFSGNIGFETDEFSGLRNSSGFNRIQASLGGPITKQLTFFVGSVLDRPGHGSQCRFGGAASVQLCGDHRQLRCAVGGQRRRSGNPQQLRRGLPREPQSVLSQLFRAVDRQAELLVRSGVATLGNLHRFAEPEPWSARDGRNQGSHQPQQCGDPQLESGAVPLVGQGDRPGRLDLVSMGSIDRCADHRRIGKGHPRSFRRFHDQRL